ncbi:Endonuclease/Exonuclease/phosphatase family protein [Malonomonas rubra DSM 5091]|uniref:Endonuclease/Exonuclease/phosphatase family protein n=1 Tax=Malonomonas rubra DSM 5091 TaxID=1122189 RepID=A0A1M6H9A0_MALRU|nr:endonuclease/exonuclease/phosphatase family protein [Malonomonas rubra]SHJ18679.1 Endonuclease/Exonuclease/phosphatase family protein [Malonomonas rubra DSM 5091]
MKVFVQSFFVVLMVMLPSFSFGLDTISICSFNIQFLGNSKERHNSALAELVKNHDIVVVQELVAPPYPGIYPDGEPYKADIEAARFFDEMKSRGFEYVLSEEDTGTGSKIHKNSSATEWWVAFYKPKVVEVANDLPHGFIDGEHADNPNFERVPYAFAFRTKEGGLDFVLISVHLQPNSGQRYELRRLHELDAIARWIDLKDRTEKDFIILGDMNIQDCDELRSAMPQGFASLNDDCLATNTNIKKAKPYDHVMYRPEYTEADIDLDYRFEVVNLVEEMRDGWNELKWGPYPGTPYHHNGFKKYFSDHNPVVFRMVNNRDTD